MHTLKIALAPLALTLAVIANDMGGGTHPSQAATLRAEARPAADAHPLAGGLEPTTADAEARRLARHGNRESEPVLGTAATPALPRPGASRWKAAT